MTEHPAYGVLRPVTAHAGAVLAANPSLMTLDGTNTWLLRDDAARSSAIVVDPGPPDDEEHVRTVIEAAGRVEMIVLTHHHLDHRGAAQRMHELTGAPVRALDPALRLGGEGLAEGDVLRGAGVEARIVVTPGHTADSLCLLMEGPDGASVLTGDTILGRGTTVIAEPDGDLGDYLDSLRRLSSLGPVRVLPGHGPELDDLAATAGRYLAHRVERLDQVRAALDELGLAPDPEAAGAVVAAVYAEVDRSLWFAAEQSVRAQLAYLRGSISGPGGTAVRDQG